VSTERYGSHRGRLWAAYPSLVLHAHGLWC
jgi:hypothetical protein